MNVFGFEIYKVVTEESYFWACFHKHYLYTGDTFRELVRTVWYGYKDGKYFVGEL